VKWRSKRGIWVRRAASCAGSGGIGVELVDNSDGQEKKTKEKDYLPQKKEKRYAVFGYASNGYRC